jgi:hypothetical protein
LRFIAARIALAMVMLALAMAEATVAAPLALRAPGSGSSLAEEVQFFWPFAPAPRRPTRRPSWVQPSSRPEAPPAAGSGEAAIPSAPSAPAGPVAGVFPKTPAIENATRVVVFGDSMAVGLADGLAGIMTEDEGFQVLRMTKTNSGIVRTDYYDWAGEVRAAIPDQPIDIAIWMIGINDRQAIRLDGESHEPKTPRWSELYQERVDELIKILQEHGAAVYWVGLPIMRAQRYSQDIAYINNAVRERAGLTGAQYIDVWDAFADADGQYSKDGPDLSGERRTMRRSDGIHLTGAGNEKLAHFVDQVIGRDISVAGVDGRRVIVQSRAGGLVVSGTGVGVDGEELAGADGGDGDDDGGIGGPAVALSTLGSGAKADGEAPLTPLFQVLIRGEALEPKPGRADDFSWPR